MFRTFFVASIRPEQRKEVDIVCRFEAPTSGSVKLADLPSAQNLGTFCFPVGSVNVKPREYSAPEVCPMPMHLAGIPGAGNCKQTLLTRLVAKRSKHMRFAAGVLLHTHRRRWQPHPWLLQVGSLSCMLLRAVSIHCLVLWSRDCPVPHHVPALAGRSFLPGSLHVPMKTQTCGTLRWCASSAACCGCPSTSRCEPT